MAKVRSKAAKILKSILIVKVCRRKSQLTAVKEVEGETDANFSRSQSSYRWEGAARRGGEGGGWVNGRHAWICRIFPHQGKIVK